MKTRIMFLLSALIITAPCSAQLKSRFAFHLKAGLYSPLLQNTEYDTRTNGMLFDGGVGFKLSEKIELIAMASYSSGFSSDGDGMYREGGYIMDTSYYVPRLSTASTFDDLRLLTFTANLKYMPWPTDWPDTYILGGLGVSKRLNELRYSPTAPSYMAAYRPASRIGTILQFGIGQIFHLNQNLDLTLEGIFRANYVEYDRGDFVFHTAHKTRLEDMAIKTGMVFKL